MGWFWKETETVLENRVEEIEIDLGPLREQAKEHVLFMLGAPVIKLEIDDGQLTHAIDYAQELVDHAGFNDETEYVLLLKEGSLAFAKYMLGRVRVKFATNPNAPADGFELINEANRDIEAFRIRIGLD